MMMEVQQEGKGIMIGGQNFNNIRYADDAVMLTDNTIRYNTIAESLTWTRKLSIQLNLAHVARN